MQPGSGCRLGGGGGGGHDCRAQPCLSFLSQARSTQAGRKGEERPHLRIPPSKGVASPPHCPSCAGGTLGWGTPTHHGVLAAMVRLPPTHPSTGHLQAGMETGTPPGSSQSPKQVKPPHPWHHHPLCAPHPQCCQPADDHLQGTVGALDEDQGLLAGPIQRRPADVHQLVARLQPAGQRGLAPVLHLGNKEECQGGHGPPEQHRGCATATRCQGRKRLRKGAACTPGTTEQSAAPGSPPVLVT